MASPARLHAEHLAHALRPEAVVEQVEVLAGDEGRVRHAAGPAERENLLAERDDVVGEARGLVRRVEAAHQPAVLRGDAGGAVARVAALRLDAPDREHRLARHRHLVAPEREREHHLLGKPSLPDPLNTTLVWSPRSAKARYTFEKPTLKGCATWSVKTSGPALVPPRRRRW